MFTHSDKTIEKLLNSEDFLEIQTTARMSGQPYTVTIKMFCIKANLETFLGDMSSKGFQQLGIERRFWRDSLSGQYYPTGVYVLTFKKDIK